MIKATQGIVILHMLMLANSMEKTQMYMKRSEASDQSMSASGYSYNAHDGDPKEFSFETDDEDKAIEILKDLGYDPYAKIGRYATEPVPLPYDQYYKEYFDSLGKTPSRVNANYEKLFNQEVKPLYGEYSPLDKYEKITYPPLYPYAKGYGHDSHDIGKFFGKFFKKGGNSYSAADFAKKGETSDIGYNKVNAFDKALKGSYDNSDRKSYYDQNGGNKQSSFDNAGNYASNNAAGHVSSGGSFSQNKGHNKGSKTTGYHKVYNKDDYNKQHKFYDKADKRGHFVKYGDHNAKHGNDQGYFIKGGNADQGYGNKEYGVKSASDQGKYDDIAKGIKSTAGNEGFYNNYAGFGKKGERESGSELGYSV